MKYSCYAIRDSKVDLFAQPMSFRSRGEAIRAFADEVNNEGSMLHKHPEDYSLYEVGEFDCVAGEFTAIKPVSCGRADQFLNKPRLAKEA